MPREPTGLNLKSGIPITLTSITPTSAFTGTWYSASFASTIRPVTEFYNAVFLSCEADAPRDPAHELIEAGLLIEEYADVVYTHNASDLDHLCVAIHSNFSKNRSHESELIESFASLGSACPCASIRLVIMASDEFGQTVGLVRPRLRYEATAPDIAVLSL